MHPTESTTRLSGLTVAERREMPEEIEPLEAVEDRTATLRPETAIEGGRQEVHVSSTRDSGCARPFTRPGGFGADVVSEGAGTSERVTRPPEDR